MVVTTRRCVISFCPIYYAYKVNNNAYVGITSKLPSERWYHHVYEATVTKVGLDNGLKGAIRKYDKDAFVVEPLKLFNNIDDLNQYEMEIVAEHELNRMQYPNGNGYNLTDRGDNYDCGKTTNYRDTTNAKKSQQKPIRTINTNDHTTFVYDSIKDAVNGTGVHRMSIFNLFKTGKRQRLGYWKFEYATDVLYNTDGTLNHYGTDHFGRKSVKKPTATYRLVLADGSIYVGNTLMEISKCAGVSISSIHRFNKDSRQGKLMGRRLIKSLDVIRI